LCACATTTNVPGVRERTRKQQDAAHAAGASRTPGAHPLLALQRTAGNRAVNALISRRLTKGRLDDDLMEPEAEAPGMAVDHGALPAVQAQAFTGPQDLHFAPGQFNLDDDLLGHEAWHVTQQRQGRVGRPY
jgi:hypothetical protein